jgi:hypothetical protein
MVPCNVSLAAKALDRDLCYPNPRDGAPLMLIPDIRPACPICGRSLTDDEARTAPLVYSDAICAEPRGDGTEPCMTWLGRTLVGWMRDEQPHRLEFLDEFWINDEGPAC